MENSFANKILKIKSNKLARAILCGFASGVMASIADIHQSINHIENLWEQSRLIFYVISTLGTFGAVLAVFTTCIISYGEKLAEKLGKNPLWAKNLTGGILFLPVVIYISIKLFSGGYTSRLPARIPLIIITILILATFLVLTFAFFNKLIKFVSSNWKRAAFAAVILIIAARGIRWFDTNMYYRLYSYLHVVLSVLTITGFLIASFILFSSVRIRKVALLVIIFVFLWIFIISTYNFNRSQILKSAVYHHTTTIANILLLAPSFTTGTTSYFNRDKLNKIKKKHLEKLRVFEDKNWPVFPEAHILLITVDALRADRLGIYGNKKRALSVHLDNWAENNATVFERAYCPAPHSSYSITSLHTSRYIYNEALLDRELKYLTIADILGESGYKTHAFFTKGIFFTEGEKVGHYKRQNFGFQKAVHGNINPSILTDNAISVIDQIVDSGEPPLFLWTHYFNVHEPYKSTRFGTSSSDRYDGEIAEVEGEIVRLINYARKNFSRDVIVAITADHGEEFKDHGGYNHGSSLYDEQIRVPLIISLPDKKSFRIENPVSTNSLAPSLLKLVGIAPCKTMTGQDLRPALINGNSSHVKLPVFASVMKQHMALMMPYKLIFDYSRGIFELYNLEKDPAEKVNIFSKEKQVTDKLTQEIFSWLDSITTKEEVSTRALNLARMRDPRSVDMLIDLARDLSIQPSDRANALELLGELGNKCAIKYIAHLLDDSNYGVTIATAMALGAMGDTRGRDYLYMALLNEDPGLRDKAALVLAHLHDYSSVPALIESLGRSDLEIKKNAIRLLGNLRARQATVPLLQLLDESKIRYLVVLALGKTGGPHVFEALKDVLKNDRHAEVKGYTAVALGWLDDKRAIPLLLETAKNIPEIKWTTEALVRLGATGSNSLYGLDFSPASKGKKTGWANCYAKKKIIPGEFLTRTACKTTGSQAAIEFSTKHLKNAKIMVSARHLESDDIKKELKIVVDGNFTHTISLTSKMSEFFIQSPKNTWKKGMHHVTLIINSSKGFEMDHFLILDR